MFLTILNILLFLEYQARYAINQQPGILTFFLLAFTGWILYLIIDFGVISRATPNIDYRSTVLLYWKVNFVELLVSFILLFVITYLFKSGGLDALFKLLHIDFTFSDNTAIKALITGFNLKIISVAVRKLKSPMSLELKEDI